jgi:hypothetical protein
MICNARSILIDVVTVVYTTATQIPEFYLNIILSFQIHSYFGHDASRKPKEMHVTFCAWDGSGLWLWLCWILPFI